MRNQSAVSLLLALSACAVAERDPATVSGGDDSVDTKDTMPLPAGELRISPARFDARVFDDQAVLRNFTASLVMRDGVEIDVSDEVKFTVADARYGRFYGNELTVTGKGAGVSEIVATYQGVSARIPLTVSVTATRNLGVDDGVARQFSESVAKGGCAPTLAYPENHTLVPANLGSLDVHWNDAKNDLFEVRVHGMYVDLTYYTTGRWMTVDNDWSKFATAKTPITIEVASMKSSNPVEKCIGAARYVDVTKDDAKGGVYYWSTDWEARAAGQSGQDIMRYDLGKPAVAPAPLFSDLNRPATTCVGCHALSRDGKRIALTMDSATGRGSVLDLASNHELMPTGDAAPRWSQAVFNPDGTKLVAVTDGKMRLMTATGQTLTSLANSPGMIAGNPEISPDGTKLVNVESSGEDDWAFGNASIVVRSFSDESNSFGPPTMVMPFDSTENVQSYYPSWSPDGKWLAITRSPNGTSFSNPDATVWVIKADGTAQFELPATTGTMDSYARWLPEANNAGDEPVYFLSFSSTRAFGTRLPDGGLPQIWITPFYPQRAQKGRDVTGPAYRAPFQSITSSNHNAQWTTSVVTAQ